MQHTVISKRGKKLSNHLHQKRQRRKVKNNAGCEARTHDLGIMRPALFQLSQTRLLSISHSTAFKQTIHTNIRLLLRLRFSLQFQLLFQCLQICRDQRGRFLIGNLVDLHALHRLSKQLVIELREQFRIPREHNALPSIAHPFSRLPTPQAVLGDRRA